MEKYFILNTEEGNENSELGLVRVVNNIPSMVKDNGNRVIFTHMGENDYKIDANFGGEDITLGILTINGSNQLKKIGRNLLTITEVSKEEARMYGLKRALSELYSEIFSHQ